MPELSVNEICEALDAEVLNRAAATAAGAESFVHFHFDSRAIDSAKTLFFAFKSDSGDGHDYVAGLQNKDGVAAVVSRDFDASGITIPLFRVADPMKAVHRLATYVRTKYRHVKYVGITGSAGKTTTKEFCYQLLLYKYRAYRSFKNWNNWIGLPFSILNMKGDEEAAVFELAMSYPGIGEINLLAEILKPDAAVILNAFPVHLEFLKTVGNVAQAKSEILDFLAADDIAFINGDLQHLKEKTLPKKGHKIYFGKNPGNDVRLENVSRKDDGSVISINFFGSTEQFDTPFVNQIHNENLFVAILAARQLGMKHFEIKEAIKTIKPMTGRGEIRKQAGFTIIDETYNSNPEALKKTMDWVDKEYNLKNGSEKIGVVGDMLELGEQEDRFHKEVGVFVASTGFQRLITVGKRAEKIADGAEESGFDAANINKFDDSSAAGKFLKATAPAGSVLLFKASRGIRLEKAIEEFLADE
ncbi:MAG: UDP-N-acetylmuramoyl-tripeptide--D-alanyl-D-alanine ligase [bacterium]|nr:UDP-N-acetylmuramoyl-tripeptide--D-alanyl-D-alanine ligase [bacterium]